MVKDDRVAIVECGGGVKKKKYYGFERPFYGGFG